MCPSLVQNVDIDGYLCSAGRSADLFGVIFFLFFFWEIVDKTESPCLIFFFF
jgi:hypothetical protein